MADNEKQWVCVVCGYVYDGDIPFEELPDDWACPVCGVDKSFSNCAEILPETCLYQTASLNGGCF